LLGLDRIGVAKIVITMAKLKLCQPQLGPGLLRQR
jgi:hypothetical protein